MARPKEEGLKYFPFDIDFFNDEKIEAISGEFGIKGEIATIKLLCAVYRNGYFIEWNEMLKMKLLKNLPGVSLDLLEQIINRLVKWEFFDKNLFDSVKILTSHGIQKRYFEAIRRRRKSKDYPYILIDGVCGCESKDALSSVDDNNSDSDEIVKCKVNVCNNPTSTDINVGNNATKESKGKEEDNIPPTPPKGEGVNSKARLLFENYFRETFSDSYYWTAKDAGAMSQLLNKLKFQRKQKKMDVSDDSLLYALQYLLSSVKEGWIFENFSVTNINSKFNEIVAQAKKSTSSKSDTDIGVVLKNNSPDKYDNDSDKWNR